MRLLRLPSCFRMDFKESSPPTRVKILGSRELLPGQASGIMLCRTKWDALPGANPLRGSLCIESFVKGWRASFKNRLWSMREKRGMQCGRIGWREEQNP